MKAFISTLVMIGMLLGVVTAMHQIHGKHHTSHHNNHHKPLHNSKVTHHNPHHNPHHQRSERNRRDQDDKVVKDDTVHKHTTLPPDETPLCDGLSDCSDFLGSECFGNICKCPEELVHILDPPSCLEQVNLEEPCKFTVQCQSMIIESECHPEQSVCVCMNGYIIETYGTSSTDKRLSCITADGSTEGSKVDPAMIGVLVGLSLMFIIICVVLRLFSKARFRETRSIFNTPNPRLMNASLFKDSKLSPARGGERRGSRISIRAPSRAASITSMNKDFAPRSPNGSLAKGRRDSSLSTASATLGGPAGAGARRPSRVSKSPSPSTEPKKSQETTVAIESVD